jgi:hypothetical protein
VFEENMRGLQEFVMRVLGYTLTDTENMDIARFFVSVSEAEKQEKARIEMYKNKE